MFWEWKGDMCMNYSFTWHVNPLDCRPLFITLTAVSLEPLLWHLWITQNFFILCSSPSLRLVSLQHNIKYLLFLTDWLRLQGTEQQAHSLLRDLPVFFGVTVTHLLHRLVIALQRRVWQRWKLNNVDKDLTLDCVLCVFGFAPRVNGINLKARSPLGGMWGLK